MQSPTQEQIDAARAILAAADQPAIEASSSATSSPAPAPDPIENGHVVINTTAAGTDRYGFVVEIAEPVIVGTDDKGAEISAAHADVVWFNGDGLTTVPVDQLRAIN